MAITSRKAYCKNGHKNFTLHRQHVTAIITLQTPQHHHHHSTNTSSPSPLYQHLIITITTLQHLIITIATVLTPHHRHHHSTNTSSSPPPLYQHLIIIITTYQHYYYHQLQRPFYQHFIPQPPALFRHQIATNTAAKLPTTHHHHHHHHYFTNFTNTTTLSTPHHHHHHFTNTPSPPFIFIQVSYQQNNALSGERMLTAALNQAALKWASVTTKHPIMMM